MRKLLLIRNISSKELIVHISSQVTEPHLVFHIFKKPMIKAAVAQDPLTRPDASSVFHPKKTPTHLDRCRERGDSLIRWGGITQSSICSTAWQTHIKAVKVAPGLAGPSSTDQGSPSDQRGFQFPLSSFFCQIEPGQGVCECELAGSSDLTIQSPHPGVEAPVQLHPTTITLRKMEGLRGASV